MIDRMGVCRRRRPQHLATPARHPPVPVVVLVDELAELYLMADKSEKDEIAKTSTALLRVAQLGRAFGIYLFCCGQRIGSDLGPGVTALRAQCSGRICHRVNDPETATMTLGDLDPAALVSARAIPPRHPASRSSPARTASGTAPAPSTSPKHAAEHAAHTYATSPRPGPTIAAHLTEHPSTPDPEKGGQRCDAWPPAARHRPGSRPGPHRGSRIVHPHPRHRHRARPTGWMSWAVAVCIDLTCVMAARERQRDKKTGTGRRGPLSWPVLVLTGGIVLSLAANLAQADPTVWGWITAATPAAAFLVAVSMLERRAAPIPNPGVSRRPVLTRALRPDRPSARRVPATVPARPPATTTAPGRRPARPRSSTTPAASPTTTTPPTADPSPATSSAPAWAYPTNSPRPAPHPDHPLKGDHR